MNPEELRPFVAAKLAAAKSAVPKLTATVGFDGFVDEIIRVVDKSEAVNKYTYVPTMTKLAEKVAGAAGKSTNMQLVVQVMKLGGNGPIMANALAGMGLKITYIGCLGFPNLHPVFEPMAKHAKIISIADPGHTDALEFEDGKIMLGKHETLGDVNWQNIVKRVGLPTLKKHLTGSAFVAYVNWTMLPRMSDIWKQILSKALPKAEPKHKPVVFFDLADPEKRTTADIREALDLIQKFGRFYRVILGLNQKEAHEIGEVLDITVADESKDSILELAEKIFAALKIERLVVHPTAYAVAVDAKGSSLVDGPYVEKPLITTGAGDHFNAGFCLGNLLGFDKEMSLLVGVSTSGFYVRTGKSPSVADLIKFMRNWPAN
jgi:sugar/nucleoside kinase (ribokinase family)